MKLFISWSGAVSQQIAQELRGWLPLVLDVEPFITTADVDKGARWQGEISKELDASNFGIVCLTRTNLSSPWLAFEAGALSKKLEGRVATLLIDVAHGDVVAPLGMFQGTLFEEQDFRQLIGSINNALPENERRAAGVLEKQFKAFWPELREAVRLIVEAAAAAGEPPAPEFDAAGTAQEMLAMLRQQNSILSSPERFLAPVLTILRDGGSTVLFQQAAKELIRRKIAETKKAAAYQESGVPAEEVAFEREQPKESK